MTTARDGSADAGSPEDGAGGPGWQRGVLVSELGQSDAAVRSWESVAFGLTRSGLTLRSRSMVHVGRVLEIRVPEAGAERPRTLYGRVTESDYQMGRGYVLKVEFCAKPARSQGSEGSAD